MGRTFLSHIPFRLHLLHRRGTKTCAESCWGLMSRLWPRHWFDKSHHGTREDRLLHFLLSCSFWCSNQCWQYLTQPHHCKQSCWASKIQQDNMASIVGATEAVTKKWKQQGREVKGGAWGRTRRRGKGWGLSCLRKEEGKRLREEWVSLVFTDGVNTHNLCVMRGEQFRLLLGQLMGMGRTKEMRIQITYGTNLITPSPYQNHLKLQHPQRRHCQLYNRWGRMMLATTPRSCASYGGTPFLHLSQSPAWGLCCLFSPLHL